MKLSEWTGLLAAAAAVLAAFFAWRTVRLHRRTHREDRLRGVARAAAEAWGARTAWSIAGWRAEGHVVKRRDRSSIMPDPAGWREAVKGQEMAFWQHATAARNLDLALAGSGPLGLPVATLETLRALARGDPDKPTGDELLAAMEAVFALQERLATPWRPWRRPSHDDPREPARQPWRPPIVRTRRPNPVPLGQQPTAVRSRGMVKRGATRMESVRMGP